MTLMHPWPKGVSGNPSGRRKTRPITELIVAELAKQDGRRLRTRDQALVERLISIALTGKRSDALKAMQLIMSYVDGLPVARQEIGAPGDFDHGFEIRLIRVEAPEPIEG